MKIQITAGGIYDGDGKEIPIGTELTVDAVPDHLVGRHTVLSGEKKTLVVNPAKSGGGDEGYVPVGPFFAKDTGGNWFTVFDANDKQVGKKLRKADGEAFNAFSDEDKAEFLAEYLPKADA